MRFTTYCVALASIPLNVTLLPETTGLTVVVVVVVEGFTAFALTVTLKVAFFLPASFAVAVIVALPAFFAVTTPLDDTVATFVLLDFHVTDFVAASLGLYVGCSVNF